MRGGALFRHDSKHQSFIISVTSVTAAFTEHFLPLLDDDDHHGLHGDDFSGKQYFSGTFFNRNDKNIIQGVLDMRQFSFTSNSNRHQTSIYITKIHSCVIMKV